MHGLVVLALLVAPIGSQPRTASTTQKTPFTTPLTVAEMANKQAVVNTSAGAFVIDGSHVGIASPAPAVNADEAVWNPPRSTTPDVPANTIAKRPFDGLRILDLGIIVAGGELGRLFADLGAEVIKIESAAYPDGLRQTPPGQVMSRSWALTTGLSTCSRPAMVSASRASS